MDNASASYSKPNGESQSSEHDLRHYSPEETIAAWGLCELRQGGSVPITPVYRTETGEDQSLPGAAEIGPKKRNQKYRTQGSRSGHRVGRLSLLSHDPLRTPQPNPLYDEHFGPGSRAKLAPKIASDSSSFDSSSSDEEGTYAAQAGEIWTNEEKARLERIIRRRGTSNWFDITGEFNTPGHRLRSVLSIQSEAYRLLDPPLHFDSIQHSEEAGKSDLNLFNDADGEEGEEDQDIDVK